MSTARWDPWSELVTLREAMGNMLDDGTPRPRETGSAPAGLAVDVRDLPDRFVVTASVPGVDPDDVEISILGEALEIRGERRDATDTEGDGGRWLVRERRFGSFERTLALPGLVQADGAEADFKDGVLTVVLPKAESAKVRVIPVRPGQARNTAAIDVSSQSSGRTGSGEPMQENA